MEQQVKEPKISDKACIAEWETMIGIFNKIISGNPAPEKVKSTLLELINSANTSSLLTPRQREGIYSRCHNYINGDWGKDAVKDAYLKGNKPE